MRAEGPFCMVPYSLDTAEEDMIIEWTKTMHKRIEARFNEKAKQSQHRHTINVIESQQWTCKKLDFPPGL